MKQSKRSSGASKPSNRSSQPPAKEGGFPTLPIVAILAVVVLIAWLVSGTGVAPSQAPEQSGGQPVIPPSVSTATPPVETPAPESTGNPPSGARPAPPVRLEPAAIRLGFVRPGSVHRTTVEVYNSSSEPLTLLGAKRGCSCTEVELTPGRIAPGTSVPVTTVFTAGLTPTDRKNTVKLQFDGYEPAELKLSADIARAVKAEPVNFRMHQRGAFDGPVANTKGRIRLTSTDGRPFRVLSAGGRPPQAWPGASSPPETPALQHQLVLDLTDLDPETLRDDQGQRFPPFWVVETDHPEAPAVEVRLLHAAHRPVRRESDRNWVFIENRVVVDPITPGESGIFELPISWTAGTRGSQMIHEVVSQSPDFRAELLGLEPDGKRSKATVRITPREDFRGVFQGTVEFVSREHRAPLAVIGAVRPTDEGRSR